MAPARVLAIAPYEAAPPGREETELIASLSRYRAGDPRGLNALMAALYPLIRRVVYRLTAPRWRGIQDDLVQVSLEQVCRAIDSFAGRSRLSSFVFGICRRVVARACRYERLRDWYRGEAVFATTPQQPQPTDEQLDTARDLHHAWQRLDRLGEKERVAFVMHDVEQLPLGEVASVLRCSTRTVKRKLRTAREKILSVR
ncbi:MAG: hypothetical protein JWM53_3907 [bacterium]|nr:hypothetical protein [bacterium]